MACVACSCCHRLSNSLGPTQSDAGCYECRAATGVASGKQWDRLNGWSPLQWMAVRGLED
ncbi:MAG: hypothetical protein EON54_15895 [Alcaligenaceae bacterium]|nr:MAG: hypothetical protein EON54_15895 [Alcaligenaceae bacterium]